MAHYVDGFVIPLPRDNVDAYCRMARKAGKKELNLRVHPIPFQGNPDKARVFLLMLNRARRRATRSRRT